VKLWLTIIDKSGLAALEHLSRANRKAARRPGVFPLFRESQQEFSHENED
jgi:hypothetical protein